MLPSSCIVASLLGLATACPSGYERSPEGTCFTLSAAWVPQWSCSDVRACRSIEPLCVRLSSLACITLTTCMSCTRQACGGDAATACIRSAADNDFAAALLKENKVTNAWLGLYDTRTGSSAQWKNPPGTKGFSWGQCSSGEETPKYRAWGISQPRTEDYHEFNCAKLFLNGLWANSACAIKKPCLCEYGLHSSQEYLEGVNERTMLGPARFATAVVFLGFVPLFWCIPCLCMMCCRCRRSSCRRRSPLTETAATVLGTADARAADLANAEKSAAKLRMRVSGTFAQLGWMCIALGLGPFLVFVNSGWFDSSLDFTATAGQPFLYLIFIPPAMMFIYLAVSPTDTRNINRIATFQIFFSLFWVMAWSGQAVANLGRGNHFGAATMSCGLLFNLHWIYFNFPVWWPIVTGWCGRKVKTLPPRRQLQRLWFQQRGASMQLALLNTLSSLALVQMDGSWPTFQEDDPYVGGLLLGASFILCTILTTCLLYTSPSPRDRQKSRMPSSA